MSRVPHVRKSIGPLVSKPVFVKLDLVGVGLVIPSGVKFDCPSLNIG